MRIGSLFSGIGGLELGLERAGLGEVVWQVEQDEWCRSVLAKHWPNVERFADVRDVDATMLSPIDLLSGGFPCQDISSAGSGAGLSGARSGLWFEFARLLQELRPRPAWVVVENVGSASSRWVDPVCGNLEQLGYETLPVPLSAQDVGAPHLRRRVFIVAHTIGEQLRYERERQPGGRAPGVCAQGNTELAHAGTTRTLANANGGGCEDERVANVSWLESSCGSELDGRPRSRSDRERGTRAPQHWWSSGTPVRGVDDGASTKLDRARLKALGNAVVPQCAQVIGEVIQLLMRGT